MQLAGQGSTTSTFTWDARNQLTQQTIAGATTNASVLYAYDADGRRIQRVANGQVTNYLWDEASPNGEVAVETDVSHTPQARYILGNGQLVAQEWNGSTSFYLQDGQQNVRGLADPTGNVTDNYLYDAYGNLQNRTGTTANPYQYTGQQFDNLTGLYNLRARSYDPTDGRFLTQDSAALDTQNPLELNRYVYTADSPVTNADPSGYGFFDFATNLLESVNESEVTWVKFGAGSITGFVVSVAGWLIGSALSAAYADATCELNFNPTVRKPCPDITDLINQKTQDVGSVAIQAAIAGLEGGVLSIIPFTNFKFADNIFAPLEGVYSTPAELAALRKAIASASIEPFKDVLDNGAASLGSVLYLVIANIDADLAYNLVQRSRNQAPSTTLFSLTLDAVSGIIGALGTSLPTVGFVNIFLGSFFTALGST